MTTNRNEKKELLQRHQDNLQNYLSLSFQKLSQLFNPSCPISTMINSAKYITKTDYSDAILERTSLELCGYPLCHRKPKTYRSAQVKVDGKPVLTEPLKPYCSINCFLASQFYQTQLSEESVQFRVLETMRQVEVVPLDVQVNTFWEERKSKLGKDRVDLAEKERKAYVQVLLQEDKHFNRVKIPTLLDKGLHEKENVPQI